MEMAGMEEWINQLLPAQDSPQPDPASGTEELPEVDSDSEEDPEEVTELEPEHTAAMYLIFMMEDTDKTLQKHFSLFCYGSTNIMFN